MNIHQSRLLILDFGSQYVQLIARRIREIGVYCEIHPFDISESTIRNFQPQGIILSGGPDTVTAESTPRAPEVIFTLGIPILGICYGMQTMAKQLGGDVVSSDETHVQAEFGYTPLRLMKQSKLFAQIEDSITSEGTALLEVWMSHGDQVSQLPQGFKMTAESDNTAIAAMGDEQRHFYGIQFHPEVTHTRQGQRILEKFAIDICGCQKTWTTCHIIEDMVAHIRETVGNDSVILGLSGGVDSSVAAALLHRAIGQQLVCVFVDNGLLRLHEAEQVLTTFRQHMGINIIHVSAEKRFLHVLKNIADPEQKRKIIGREFIAVFEEQACKLPQAKWLAQGTIYPDVIESAVNKISGAQMIKTHHNVGGLPEVMQLQLIEPLRELFKDEVRQIGLELGLPYEMTYRHPFPGPGLGVRILGEVTKAYADKLRSADHIFIEELRKHGLYEQVSQAFAVYLPIHSVGVVGDARQYAPVIALRAVETVDFMTARWAHLPYEFLGLVSHRIVNEVKGISRVVYDISGKPPATIEWE